MISGKNLHLATSQNHLTTIYYYGLHCVLFKWTYCVIHLADETSYKILKLTLKYVSRWNTLLRPVKPALLYATTVEQWNNFCSF